MSAFPTTLAPRLWSFRQRCIVGALVSFGVLGYALCLQYFGGLDACPLCTLQRVVFVLLGLGFVAASVHAPDGRRARRGHVALILAWAATGVAIALRHVWLQLLPQEQLPDCGPGLMQMLRERPVAETLRKVFAGSGECVVIDWQLLGLSMPAWSLLTYLALALWAWVATEAPKGAARPN